jgi:regulator of PEP synthase PpsR (kinase-PPPase family)
VMHFSNWIEREPLLQPGLTRQLDEDYFQRITALEFAVRHDDGRNAADLDKADLVLVGLSRTSKTPLSVYLAYRGWLVGNVPIIPNMDLPPILFDLPPKRVVGLAIRPERLTRLRGQRQRHLGVVGDYADPDSIRLEVQYAHSLFAKAGWPLVDVTAKSIEETATEIMSLVYRGE